MKKILLLCAALLALAASAGAQNNRLEPLSGIPSFHIAEYTEMPTQEPVLFSMLMRMGWTNQPLWIYATDSTELILKARWEPLMDTNIQRLKIEKADMDSLLSMIHSAVATSSFFDVEDYCKMPDTLWAGNCMDCGTMVLQYAWRWAISDGLTHNRKTNVGNLSVIFDNIREAILKDNIDKFKAELPYIYDLAATFRSYYPKTKLRLLWW